jgi:hypothetical protein
VFIGLILLVIIAVDAYGGEKEEMIAQFDRFDNAINGGQGHSKKTNESTVLMWAESYLLEAYLVMYEATGDKKYIEKFMAQAEDVYNSTDKKRGVKDYNGRIRTGWSTTKGSKGKAAVVTILGTGMICQPFVRFAVMVKERKELAVYKGIANKYVVLAEQAVTEFNNQWSINSQTGEGYYNFEGDEPNKENLDALIAFNGTMGIGRLILLLYQVTGKNEYFIKAKGLAVTLQRNLTLTKNNSYVWGYRPDLSKTRRIEDISHGAIDVDFVIKASKNNIIFNNDDLKRFANTIIHTYQNNRFSVFVDGTNDRKGNDYSNAAARWLDLCTVNCKVYAVVNEYNSNKLQQAKKEHPAVMLGLAKLIKYYDTCHIK